MWEGQFKLDLVLHNNITEEILRQEVGAVFAAVLEHAGVFKCTPEGREAFLRFIHSAEM